MADCSGYSMPSATTSRCEGLAQAEHRGGQPRGHRRCAGGQQRAVHLEDVEREAAEVAQRRVAGPEVVHREADAERAQLVRAAHREVDVGHHHRLGDLERERRRLEPGVGQRLADVGDDVGLEQLLDRQVDADRSGGSRRVVARGRASAWRQPSRSTQRPMGTISPLSSANGMNSMAGSGRGGWRQRSSASTPVTAPS